jgi:hypothetical protein
VFAGIEAGIMPLRDPVARRAYQAAYRAAHREECAAKSKTWREANPEQFAAKRDAWYRDHREYAMAQARQWVADHLAQSRAIKLKYAGSPKGRARMEAWASTERGIMSHARAHARAGIRRTDALIAKYEELWNAT